MNRAGAGTEAAVGLTGAEAAARLEKHGPNALKQAKKRPSGRCIWRSSKM